MQIEKSIYEKQFILYVKVTSPGEIFFFPFHPVFSFVNFTQSLKYKLINTCYEGRA